MNQKKIERQKGTTTAERYLARLCERTFLSLWSYPNVFRDAAVSGARTGKEVCDLPLYGTIGSNRVGGPRFLEQAVVLPEA